MHGVSAALPARGLTVPAEIVQMWLVAVVVAVVILVAAAIDR